MQGVIHLHGYGYEAEICPERGANLISLTRGDMRSVRTPGERGDFSDSPFFWGCPLLFPPNRLSEASFSFENRRYSFPMDEPQLGNSLHGCLHAMPFTRVFSAENEAEFVFHATKDEPYLSFPHAFTLTIRYTLYCGGMRQELILRNDSAWNMPYAIGFHTTFQIPFTRAGQREDLRLYLDVGSEIIRDEIKHLPDGRVIHNSDLLESLQKGVFKPDGASLSRHFEMGGGREMILRDQKAKRLIRYRASEGYRYWILFHPKDSDFLCVEPQTWMVNCPNAPFPREETGFVFLKPGSCCRLETVLSLEDY